jgi:PAS domain S-box-containing protein
MLKSSTSDKEENTKINTNDNDIMKYKLANEALGVALWDMAVVRDDPLNPENKFFWSQEFRHMLGFDDESDFPNVLHSWSDRLHPEDKKRSLEAFIAHLNDYTGNTPYNIEYRLKLKNGDYRYFHAFGTALRDDSGAPLRVSGALIDVNEEKQTQSQLLIMSNIVRNSPNFISYKKIDGECLYVNPTAVLMTGYSEEELKTDYLGSLLDDKTKQSVIDKVLKGLRKSGISRYEVIGTIKDGSKRIFAGTSFLIGEDAYSTILSDVTDIRKNEAEKIKTLDTIKKIFDAIDAFFCVTVPETGEILYLNDHFRGFRGVEDDRVGRICWEVLQNKDERCDYCPYYQLEKEPDKVIVWEQDDPIIKRTIRKTAMLIDWPDRGKAHLEYGIDITDTVQMRKDLERRIVLMNALNKSLEISVSYTEDMFSNIMSNALRPIADAADLDRIIFFRVWEKDRLYAGEVYRWDKKIGGTAPVDDALKVLPVFGAMKRWISVMSDDVCVSIKRSEFQEDEAAFLGPRGVMSIFIAPIFIEGNLWGVATFHDNRNERDFDEDCTAMLRSASRLCAVAIIRDEKTQTARHATEELNRREKMLATLNNAAMAFLQGDIAFGDTMTAGVGIIAEAFNLDRVSLWRNFTTSDGDYAAQVYQWDKDSGGTTESMQELDDIIYSKIAPQWLELFLSGKSLNGPVREIPSGAFLKTFGIVSAFIPPIMMNGKFWGVVIFEDRHNERYFDAVAENMLRSAALLCVNTAIKAEMELEVIEAEVFKKTREADEFTRLMFDAMPIACDLWNKDYQIIDCNEETLKLFGIANKDEYRENFTKFSPERQSNGVLSQNRVREVINTVFEIGFLRFEWLHNDIKGEPIPVVIHAKRVTYHGEYVVAGYKYDMRDERKAQEQMHLAEKSSELMFGSMPLCSWMWFEDLTMIDCNQEAVKLFGLSSKQEYKNIFPELSPEFQPDGRNSMETAIDEVKKTLITGYNRFEWLHQTINGEPLPCEVSLVRSELNGKKVVLAYARDLREQKKMLAAEAASHAKTAFLSNMSHEMRTPMNAIIGMTAIGKNAGDIERKDYAFSKIEDASTHLLGVINDVLDISKIEANMLELSPVEFDFERMIHKVVSVINFRMDEKQHDFKVNMDGNLPRFLISDDQRLAQVIMNLLSNSVKFTPEGGKIQLDASMTGESGGLCELQISVTDSGIGISPEQQEKLFKAFSQAESGISRDYGGTGLGLAISKRIVEMMDGEMKVESELGKGARFIFTIKAARGTRSIRSLLAPGVNWETIRILAVDDMVESLEYLKSVFDQLNVKCDTASGGEQALKMMKENEEYDICFIDWRMPGMDGIELTRMIKTGRSSKPSVVVIISAYNWEEVKEAAVKAGVDKFLAKPLLSSAIIDCVNDCLGIEDYEEGQAASGTFEGRHILLAEDIEINREIVLALLDGTGLEIDSAENGSEALNKIQADPDKYDLVFMDVQMPEMDGLEATRRIRALPSPHCRKIPIIAMTANVFKDDIEKCIEAGMDDHLGKPLDMEKVFEKLRKYLNVR